MFFLLKEVEYLGHKISAQGLKPSMEKVRAMVVFFGMGSTHSPSAKELFG